MVLFAATCLRISPPLVITDKEIEYAFYDW